MRVLLLHARCERYELLALLSMETAHVNRNAHFQELGPDAFSTLHVPFGGQSWGRFLCLGMGLDPENVCP